MALQQKLNTQDFNVETKGRLPEVHRFEALAEVARRRGEKEMELANNNIRNEYRKRLHDTKTMKDKMESRMFDLKIEINHCERVRREVISGLKNFEPVVSLSMAWNNARKGRPSSPSVFFENVVRALSQNNDELKQHMAKLADALSLLDRSLTELRNCETFLLKEINAKMSTMVIDNACMEELIRAKDLMGADHGHLTHSAILRSAALHTDREWTNVAESVISIASNQVEVAQGHRKTASNIVRSLTEAGKYHRSPLVLDALAARIKYNQGQCGSLEANIAMVSGQIDNLGKKMASLVGSLEKVMEQMATAKQRLNLRAMLPERENTRPGVETTLEIEICNMKNSEKQLRHQLTECEKKLIKHRALLQQMQTELTERSAAVELDKKCHAMKPPPASQTIPNPPPMPAESSDSIRSSRRAYSEDESQRSSQRSSRRSIPAPPSQKANPTRQPQLPPVQPPSPRGSKDPAIQALLRPSSPSSSRSCRSSRTVSNSSRSGSSRAQKPR